MALPPGYGYPSYADLKTMGEQSMFDSALTFVLGTIICLSVVYVIGFVVFFVFHLLFLQMVTPGLALLRAAVWPIFWATGWPHGVPLPMD